MLQIKLRKERLLKQTLSDNDKSKVTKQPVIIPQKKKLKDQTKKILMTKASTSKQPKLDSYGN
jgi:hypothetical protein